MYSKNCNSSCAGVVSTRSQRLSETLELCTVTQSFINITELTKKNLKTHNVLAPFLSGTASEPPLFDNLIGLAALITANELRSVRCSHPEAKRRDLRNYKIPPG